MTCLGSKADLLALKTRSYSVQLKALDAEQTQNPTTIIAESPTAIFTKNPTTATVESPTTIIADSPITNITEIPILRPFPGRRDGSGCQTEERRYITGRNEVPLSAVFKGSKTEGRGGIAKVTQPDPLWDRRLKSKPSNLEGRLDKLERTVDHLNPTEPYIVHRLGALEKRVDNLEIAAGEMRDTIKGVQNDISGLQRAKDKTLAYIHKELEKLKNGSATRPANISVKLDFS
ncbi:hypothetical protein FGG08_005613 [Glutinoglossum americanum]|uniref:Uncharacterized protein n=1 Tax=Glutinoglossum americanum TaxID=1670608 RepID=A0A9P8HXV7_9PEZI|nr:hypothetical protein FGG08_005613 [Glutinoglossum americanum]